MICETCLVVIQCVCKTRTVLLRRDAESWPFQVYSVLREGFNEAHFQFPTMGGRDAQTS